MHDDTFLVRLHCGFDCSGLATLPLVCTWNLETPSLDFNYSNTSSSKFTAMGRPHIVAVGLGSLLSCWLLAVGCSSLGFSSPPCPLQSSFLNVYVWGELYVCMSVGAHGIQRRVSDPLEVTGSCESPEVGTGNRTSDPLQEQSGSRLFGSIPLHI